MIAFEAAFFAGLAQCAFSAVHFARMKSIVGFAPWENEGDALLLGRKHGKAITS